MSSKQGQQQQPNVQPYAASSFASPLQKSLATSAGPATYGYQAPWAIKAGGNEPGGADDPPPTGTTATSTSSQPDTPQSTYTPWRSPGFFGTPYRQTYGGFANQYADDGAQYQDSLNMVSTGAGRFGANDASRFGFAGGSYWFPDTMGYGPATQSPYQPAPALAAPPPPQPPWIPPGSSPPGGPSTPAPGAPGMGMQPPPASPGSGAGMNMQSWRALASSNPVAAQAALDHNPAFLQSNQGAIGQAFRQANSPQSSNAGAISTDDFQKLQSAGMTQRPPEWALAAQRKAKAAGQSYDRSYDPFL